MESVCEVGVTFQVIWKEVNGCPCGGSTGGSAVWVGDMVGDTVHLEGFGEVPTQGGLQIDNTATSCSEKLHLQSYLEMI